jgi:hypothetical protein
MVQRETLLFIIRGILLLVISIFTSGFSSPPSDYILLFLFVFGLVTVLTGIALHKEKMSINLEYRPKKQRKKKANRNRHHHTKRKFNLVREPDLSR